MKKVFLFFVFATGLIAENVLAQKKFELGDYAKLTGLSDPQLSPDEKSIVVIASRPDYTLNRFNPELVLVDIATGRQTVLTQDRLSVSQPRWSPNGSQLSFLARTNAGLQLFILPMMGGEARQLTKTAKGIQHYAWNPDGTAIAFVTADEAKNKAAIDKGFTGFEVGNNDLFIGAQPTPSHIWWVSTITGEQKRLTSGDWSLPVTIPPGPPSSPLSWSADGKTIAFVKVPNPYSGDGLFRTIQLLHVADGSMQALTTRTKMESYPSFSPDGQRLAYWYKKDGRQEDITEIWVSTTTGMGKNLTAALDRDLYRALWMPDGKSLLVGGHDNNKTSLWVQPLEGPATKIEMGAISPAWSFWIDACVGKKGGIALIGSEASSPTELYYLASPKATPQRLTDFNREVRNMQLGKTSTIQWESDGWKHSGIVTYPVNYQMGRQYPLVLVVHGGPNAASVELFSRFAQILSNEGFLVFEPNYRGSDNQGSAYKTAIVADAGAGPGRDVMAGLAQLKSMGMVDTARIGVSGWSYGGYMTAWLAGHYGGWKAAMAGAAVTDLVDQYNFSDGNSARATAYGGSPWVGDNMTKYAAQSPITEARNITAPTLILANTGDPRVPISQSYKLYHALKDHGVVTKFFAWPIAAHNASDPITQMERDRLWVGWFNQYLKK